MWYAECMIPKKLFEKMKSEERRKLVREIERRLLDPELARECVNKLKKLKLVGEWLVELWYYEIFEERKDYATGTSMEEKGLNVWRAEWIYTAVPLSVIEMDNEIVKTTHTKKKLSVDKLVFNVEAYFTIAEED